MPHAAGGTDWEKLWSAGLAKGAKFDVGKPSQALAAELLRTNYPPGGGMSALVPGCGRAYDALALARHGFDSVVAVDISPTACDAALAELKQAADPAKEKVEVKCADFFELKGRFDFIWDCTFLCALEPAVRTRWASQHHRLLAPGGKLVCCVFPIREKEGGPPYSLSVPLVRSLLEPHLKEVEVREDLPLHEMHSPGDLESSDTCRTAIAVWTPRDSA